MCLIDVPEEENKGGCKEAIIKNIWAEDLPELQKKMVLKMIMCRKGYIE